MFIWQAYLVWDQPNCDISCQTACNVSYMSGAEQKKKSLYFLWQCNLRFFVCQIGICQISNDHIPNCFLFFIYWLSVYLIVFASWKSYYIFNKVGAQNCFTETASTAHDFYFSICICASSYFTCMLITFADHLQLQNSISLLEGHNRTDTGTHILPHNPPPPMHNSKAEFFLML